MLGVLQVLDSRFFTGWVWVFGTCGGVGSGFGGFVTVWFGGPAVMGLCGGVDPWRRGPVVCTDCGDVVFTWCGFGVVWRRGFDRYHGW